MSRLLGITGLIFFVHQEAEAQKGEELCPGHPYIFGQAHTRSQDPWLPEQATFQKLLLGASLVAQWLRTRLPMQGTRV